MQEEERVAGAVVHAFETLDREILMRCEGSTWGVPAILPACPAASPGASWKGSTRRAGQGSHVLSGQ